MYQQLDCKVTNTVFNTFSPKEIGSQQIPKSTMAALETMPGSVQLQGILQA